MNVIEIHPWGARLADAETPDRIVFDLDPAPDVGWHDVKRAATAVRERLALLKLESFLRTSGGKGLHVEIGRATSELQSLMRISYAVFCLKKKKQNQHPTTNRHIYKSITNYTKDTS